MAGISSKAMNFGNIELKKKFVGQELDEELGINWYQFKYRNHDPQIGRFIQIDPLADNYEYNSVYAYAENRVINGIDLEGLEYLSAKEGLIMLRVQLDNDEPLNNKIKHATVLWNRDNISSATLATIRAGGSEKGFLRDALDPDPNEFGSISIQPTFKTGKDVTETDITSAQNAEVKSIGQKDSYMERLVKTKKEKRQMEKNRDFWAQMIDAKSSSTKMAALEVAFSLTEMYFYWSIGSQLNADVEKARIQSNSSATAVLSDLIIALNNNYITPSYRNNYDLTDLANYLLFGKEPLSNNGFRDNNKVKDFESIKQKITTYKNNETPSCVPCAN